MTVRKKVATGGGVNGGIRRNEKSKGILGFWRVEGGGGLVGRGWMGNWGQSKITVLMTHEQRCEKSDQEHKDNDTISERKPKDFLLCG
ncbi:hypothetical protein L1887_16422 [Cichorium endivia]|nr:hypothetical protein L1887_16422 [Cichorium endivia]